MQQLSGISKRIIKAIVMIVVLLSIFTIIRLILIKFIIERKTNPCLLLISQNGDFLASYSYSTGPGMGLNYSLDIFDINDKNLKLRASSRTMEMSFSCDSKQLVISDISSKAIYVINTLSGKMRELSGKDIDIKDPEFVEFIAVQNLILIGGCSKDKEIYNVYLINPDTKEILREISLPLESEPIGASGDTFDDLKLIFATYSYYLNSRKISILKIKKMEILKEYYVDTSEFELNGRKFCNYKYPTSTKFNELARNYNVFLETDKNDTSTFTINSFEKSENGGYICIKYVVKGLEGRRANSFYYSYPQKKLAVGHRYTELWKIKDDGVVILYDAVTGRAIDTFNTKNGSFKEIEYDYQNGSLIKMENSSKKR